MLGRIRWMGECSPRSQERLGDAFAVRSVSAEDKRVRKALDARNASGDFPPVAFTPFQHAYKALTDKLQPLVYALGFLKA